LLQENEQHLTGRKYSRIAAAYCMLLGVKKVPLLPSHVW